MVRRKGELTAHVIDRRWPHQVAIRQESITSALFNDIKAFCQAHDAAPRGHSVVRDDQWWNVHCFASEAHARAFLDRFAGVAFNPADRGKGDHWQAWKR